MTSKKCRRRRQLGLREATQADHVKPMVETRERLSVLTLARKSWISGTEMLVLSSQCQGALADVDQPVLVRLTRGLKEQPRTSVRWRRWRRCQRQRQDHGDREPCVRMSE